MEVALPGARLPAMGALPGNNSPASIQSALSPWSEWKQIPVQSIGIDPVFASFIAKLEMLSPALKRTIPVVFIDNLGNNSSRCFHPK
jgi:hypothetical protein